MTTIEGFESSIVAEEVEGAQPLVPDFESVFDALHHNIEVAENAFARAAKKRLHQRFEDYHKHLVTTKEGRALRPQWFWQAAVTLSMPPNPDKKTWALSKARWAVELDLVVTGLVEFIIKTLEHGSVTFIDALQVQILRVGEFDYCFRIKQFWAKGGQ